MRRPFARSPCTPAARACRRAPIWSWISDANRAVIVDFVRRKLRVGGVLYISYNTQPGWAAMVPMRDLLTEHAQVLGAPGHGIASRIDASLAFAERLMDSNCHYA